MMRLRHVSGWYVPIALPMPPLFGGGDVYWVHTGTLTRTLTASTSDWSTGSATTYTQTCVDFCIDRLSELVFQADNTVLYSRALSATGGTPTTVATFTNAIQAIDCDPTNERIFVLCFDGSTVDLRKINYDGTGDTQLISWSGSILSDRVHVQYDLTSDTIYYIKQVGASPGNVASVRRIAPDGTGDTLIRTLTDAASAVSMACLGIDVVNRFLFLSEESSNAANTLGIRRSAMDGTSSSIIFTPADSEFPPNFYFCQREAKLYVWDYDSAPDTGTIKRMDGDGSNSETLVTLQGPFEKQHHKFALGSGFEELGAGAIL